MSELYQSHSETPGHDVRPQSAAPRPSTDTLGKASSAIAAGAVLVGLTATMAIQFVVQSGNYELVGLLNAIFIAIAVLAQLVALVLGLVAARDAQSSHLWAGIGIGISAATLVGTSLTQLGVWIIWSTY